MAGDGKTCRRAGAAIMHVGNRGAGQFGWGSSVPDVQPSCLRFTQHSQCLAGPASTELGRLGADGGARGEAGANSVECDSRGSSWRRQLVPIDRPQSLLWNQAARRTAVRRGPVGRAKMVSDTFLFALRERMLGTATGKDATGSESGQAPFPHRVPFADARAIR